MDGHIEDIFDPKIHLNYQPPSKTFTLEDFQLQPTATSTQVAATVPFPILSPEGVRAYRRSLFSPKVLAHCAGSPNPGALTLRNAAAHSTFVDEFWNHPETMRVLSEAAGVPLSIVMKTEIGHTNIQTRGSTVEEMIAELKLEPEITKVPLTKEQLSYDPLHDASIIPWHYDSYPYVCVIMLSDTDGMIGGETYVKTGNGIPMKVEGPQLGWGVILQGGEVEHLAARSMGVTERISTITSFCADLPNVQDSSFLTNIRHYSDRPTLFKQWTEFRLGRAKRQIESLLQQMAETDTIGDVSQIQRFAEDQIEYMKRTARQLIDLEEYESIRARFGSEKICAARTLWKQAETLVDFPERVASVTRDNWMPESRLWIDLEETRLAVKLGRALESQGGRFKWTKQRQFLMGDELLRQGLPEFFLIWLDATGLYSMVTSSGADM